MSVACALASAGGAAAAPDPVGSTGAQGAAAAVVSDAAARVAAVDAELAAARAAVDRAAREASAAAEAYNGARALLDQRTSKAAEAQTAADVAAHAAQVAAIALSRYAAELFQSGGGLGQLDVFFGAGPQSVLDRAAGLEVVGEERVQAVREADAARAATESAQQAAAEARAHQVAAESAAQQAALAASARSAEVEARVSAVRQRQVQLTVELAVLRQTSPQAEDDRQSGLVAAEQARREEANVRRALTAASRQSMQQALPASVPERPAGELGGAAAVAFARAQLSDPYAWAGAGPDAWDCSGLTMVAWEQAGKRLAHHTESQWAQTRHVPLAEAQPGDLVFYGTSEEDIYHVGLYVGAGRMIHAPRPSDIVKESSIFSMSDLLPQAGRP